MIPWSFRLPGGRWILGVAVVVASNSGCAVLYLRLEAGRWKDLEGGDVKLEEMQSRDDPPVHRFTSYEGLRHHGDCPKASFTRWPSVFSSSCL